MRTIKLITLFSLLVVAFTGCKYEEGPFISVIPKVERVANTWIVSSGTINGSTGDFSDIENVTFYKEGGFNMVFNFLGGQVPYNGSWTFNSDKSTLIITSTDELTGLASYDREWTILKLKEDHLHVTWTEPGNNGDLYDVNFAPKQP